MHTAVILDNIRSVHNVGSIFRTANALGVSLIYCAGVTPVPSDRFGKARRDFAKVSLGAEKSVAWKHVPDTLALIRTLKKEGYTIIAIEQDKKSQDIRSVKASGKTAIVLGTEVMGLSSQLLQEADIIAEIPMRGMKESLNVSVAFGIAGYTIFNS